MKHISFDLIENACGFCAAQVFDEEEPLEQEFQAGLQDMFVFGTVEMMEVM